MIQCVFHSVISRAECYALTNFIVARNQRRTSSQPCIGRWVSRPLSTETVHREAAACRSKTRGKLFPLQEVPDVSRVRVRIDAIWSGRCSLGIRYDIPPCPLGAHQSERKSCPPQQRGVSQGRKLRKGSSATIPARPSCDTRPLLFQSAM